MADARSINAFKERYNIQTRNCSIYYKVDRKASTAAYRTEKATEKLARCCVDTVWDI